MNGWQGLLEQAEQNLRHIEGVKWGDFFTTERGELTLGIEARKLYLKSLRATAPQCDFGVAMRDVVQRRDFVETTLSMLYGMSLSMQGDNIANNLRDDINLMLLMVDRQTAAFALEWNTPAQIAS